MSKEPIPGEAAGAELLRQFQELISGMSVADLRAVSGQVLSLASGDPLAALRAGRGAVTRRRARRGDEVTFRVRVDLAGATPPIWRRLELTSSMFLGELHQVLQAAFGWTDTHLHRFALGSSVWDEASEKFLCPYDVEEGDGDGVPAAGVRLDEVLGDAGDVLLYVYDYGDDWEHRIRLEAVVDRAPDARPALCTGGRRAAPPEDCGGIHAYDDMASRPGDDAWDRFDVDVVNEVLRSARQLSLSLVELPDLVASMLNRAVGTPAYSPLAELVVEADLGSPVEVRADEAAAMVHRYAWLLDRVGSSGIKLTSAGFLPPVHVEAAFTELGMSEEWIGKGNREDLTLPVLELRESAQRLGLVRKYRGSLLLSKPVGAVRADPVALWWHLAELLPVGRADSIEHHLGMLDLLWVAAGRDLSTGFSAVAAGALSAHGWRVEGHPISPRAVGGLTDGTLEALRQLRALDPVRRRGRVGPPTTGGRLLARAALRARAAKDSAARPEGVGRRPLA